MAEALPPVVLSDRMRRECERKGVTDPQTVHTIAMFETFLRNAGPPTDEPWTEDQKAFMRAALADEEWRGFLLGAPE